MGKDTKGDRKATKPSSSARAAEVLASKAAAGGFGFGGFSGANPIGANVPGFGFGGAAAARLVATAAATSASGDDGATTTAAAPGGGEGEVPLTAQVDGELAQCIRHLAKRDPTTKTKALQNLRALIPSRSQADLATALPPWIYMYRRLIMDGSRAVRSETASTLAVLLGALGKAVAPHLKALLGPWWLAMHDPYGEAAAASRRAFEASFPAGKRQMDVLLYCRAELMSYLRDQLAATPQQLGDPKKDGPEELEERHERVQAAVLAAMAALVEQLAAAGAPGTGTGSAGEASGGAEGGAQQHQGELVEALRGVLCKPGFWKATAASKSALMRRAAYGLAGRTAQRAPGLLAGCVSEAAPLVLGALGDKEPGNHGAMWEAVLSYGKFCPDAWSHVNLRKMLLPRLYALLRHGCYGSAPTSLRALLPLLPLLPRTALGPGPEVLLALLEALWAGMQDPACAARPARAACLAAYRECLGWGLINSPRLAATPSAAAAAPAVAPDRDSVETPVTSGTDEAAAYCRTLLQGTAVQHVLPAAVVPGPAGEAAADTVAEVAQLLAQAAATAARSEAGGDGADGAAAVALSCLSGAVGSFLAEALTTATGAAAEGAGDGSEAATQQLADLCSGVASLLGRLQRRAPACPQLAATAAAAAAQSLMAAGGLGAGLPPAASQLLATLLRGYGAATAPPSVTSTLSRGPSGSLSVWTGGDGEASESAAAVTAAGGSVPSTPGATSVAASLMAGSSLSLDVLIRSYCNGPAEGPAAEATASLLIAFCHSHDDSAGLWDQILAAASAATAAAPTAAHLKARPSKPPQLDGDSPRMQRTLLLLRHCADSLTEQVGDTGAAASGIGSPAAPAEPQAWPSPALDALAVQLAEERASLSASGAAAAVLATALGANGAGVVLLQRPAADRVLGILAARLTAAVGVSCEANHDDGGEAADVPVGQAVAALQPLLCNSRCGAWRQLPERMCECVAVVAQLAWRAAPAAATTSSVAARSAAAAAVGWGPSWSRHAGLGPRADGAHEVDGDGEGAYDSGDEEAGGDGATGRADVVLHYASDEGEDDGDDGELAGGARGGAAAAARCWADGAPLGAAAKALSPARAAALAMHLAALLAAAVPGGKESAAPEVGFPPLGPRAWAVHSARLLRVVPGGWQRRQAALAVLLSGRADWSTWSAFATGRTGEAAPATAGSSGSQAAAAAVPTATATLEYLARLVEGVGPEAALGLGGGEVEEEEGAEGTVGTGGSGAPAAGKAGLRSWLLVELLAGRQAAEASGLRAEETDDDEDDEDEEEDEDEEGSAGPRYGHRHRGSRAWLRVVQRVGDALLEHVVYGNMDGLDEQYGGGRTPYGDLLHAVVDELAEGCRGGAAASEAAFPAALSPHCAEELPPHQAAYLSALEHVASALERAAPPASPTEHHTPLLAHQQRLSRFWLATTRPDDDTRTGLPPAALLRLLPHVAGPIRACAAAAAARGSTAAAESVLAAARLPELAASWVRHSLARPAVLVEPGAPAVAALQVAVACFPLPAAGSGVAGALALARAGGGALVEEERTLLMQLVRHQLVRHAGLAAARRQAADGSSTAAATSEQQQQDSAATSTSTSWPHSDAARTCIARLSYSAVSYHWRGLGQPDWHAVLSGTEAALVEAVAALAVTLERLAAAARTAAEAILGSTAAAAAASGPMALQLLRKLSQRGVLSRHPAGDALREECEAALGACVFGSAAVAAVQLAGLLVELQDEVAATSGGNTASGAAAAAREYGNTVSACCSAVLQLAVQLGGVECYCQAFGDDCTAAAAAWLDDQRPFWSAAAACAAAALVPSRQNLGAQAAAAAVEAQAPALRAVGLDAVGALMALALVTHGSGAGSSPAPPSHGSREAIAASCRLLQPVAYRLLLGDVLLGQITLAEVAGGSTAGGSDVELPEYEGDDVSYLLAGGIRPEMAPLLLPSAAEAEAGPEGQRAYLTAWSLLLSHMLDLGSGARALAVLRTVLREAGHLVHGLLGQVVPQLDLKGAAGAAGGGAAGKAASAAAAGDDGWRLADTLRGIGLPQGRTAVRSTCRTLYRAVLRALPATARVWFGDLRDRGLAAAVESYTAAAEGPALLAAEMASVQALGRGASGGDTKFTVRASPQSREVVAVMEVEDGAVIELLVKLPACLPLKAPEVECRRKVGVTDTRLRKWLLSIATFLRHQNGSVADAIGLWKRNVDSEFEGVEACLICYSVISSVNAQLPRLVCRTCNVRFHPACLYKWFKSAGKSQCPHCQALW